MSALKNPYVEQLSRARDLISKARSVEAADERRALTTELVPALGRMARRGRETGNVALLYTARAFLSRYAEATGIDGEKLLEKANWMVGLAPTNDCAWCTWCGRGWRRGDQSWGWTLHTVTLRETLEMVACCSPSCAEQLVASSWPGYASFQDELGVKALAKALGVATMLPPPSPSSSSPKKREAGPS
jgi:hypothetical protein